MIELATEGFVTSYVGLFRAQDAGRPAISAIEIPIIQRDYAQGRDEARAKEILANFLEALHHAVTTGDQLSLDFVYGDIDGTHTFKPLDGQQRLTTLFLLHWYLANRAGHLDEEHGWKEFSYATRPGARLFCRRLSTSQAPVTSTRLSDWIIDQSWYQYVWRHDPTIKSMLAVLDAIQLIFASDDDDRCATAWRNLVGPHPAVRFHVLLLPDTGTGANLYIKMNSRGKPLTDFENFKARFEASVDWAGQTTRHDLASKLDGAWSDLLWKISKDDLVDDDFINYIGYVTEICEWLQGDSISGRLGPRAENIFGAANPDADRNLELLANAFDTWLDPTGKPVDVDAAFDEHFMSAADLQVACNQGKLPLFGRSDVNLLRACCHTYGAMSGRTRVFSLGDSLLLYGVLLHRKHNTDDFPRRLRMLRNLIEASVNELRPERGPELIADVRHLVLDGALDKVRALNQRQVVDEQRKRDFLCKHPELEAVLFRLEDHTLLRGRLAAFAFDLASFESRARVFAAIMQPEYWPTLTAALLTKGTYGRDMSNGYFRLGSPEAPRWWRELLTEANDVDTERTRETLGAVLDDLAASSGDLVERLHDISKDWLATAGAPGSESFDWRYYLVRYDAMREGKTGVYYSPSRRMGYELCMLSTQTILGHYRDPYLQAIVRARGVDGDVDDRPFRYDVPRWLRLKASGTELRVVDQGLEIRPSDNSDHAATLRNLLQQRTDCNEVAGSWIVPVAQSDRGGLMIDSEDRVQLGARLLCDLAAAGL